MATGAKASVTVPKEFWIILKRDGPAVPIHLHFYCTQNLAILASEISKTRLRNIFEEVRVHHGTYKIFRDWNCNPVPPRKPSIFWEVVAGAGSRALCATVESRCAHAPGAGFCEPWSTVCGVGGWWGFLNALETAGSFLRRTGTANLLTHFRNWWDPSAGRCYAHLHTGGVMDGWCQLLPLPVSGWESC